MKNQLKTLIARFNKSTSSKPMKTENFIDKGKLDKIKKSHKTRQHLPN